MIGNYEAKIIKDFKRNEEKLRGKMGTEKLEIPPMKYEPLEGRGIGAITKTFVSLVNIKIDNFG